MQIMLFNLAAGFYSLSFGGLGFALLFFSKGNLAMIGIGLGLIAVGAGIVWFMLQSKKKLLAAYEEFINEVRKEQKKSEAAARKYRQEHPYPEAEEFFRQVRNAGIPNLDSKANVSRLLLYAKNNGIETPKAEMIEQFNLGRQYVERHEAKAQAQQAHDRLSEMSRQEKELASQYTYYANYTDQDKSIRICQDKIREANEIIYQCEQDETSVRNGGEATYMLGRQKESSWAIHGGIASGIAGGAAGLAVAADVERRNQEKRQQNEQLLKGIAALSVMQLEKIWDRKRRAEQELEYWTAKLEEAKVLLSEKLNQKELLAMLHPGVMKVDITETGAVKLKIELHSTPNLIIFDEIKAVVDGSIKVLLKVEDEVVGSAICVLPYGGMTSYATVNGICCKPKKQAREYTFDFAPNHLWAVETKKDVSDSWGYEQRKRTEALEQEKKRAELLSKIVDTMDGKCPSTFETIDYVEILTAMKGKGALTVPQIQANMPNPENISTQRISALLRVLAEGSIVERTEDKRRSFWEYK
jgi:hypothetical protein